MRATPRFCLGCVSLGFLAGERRKALSMFLAPLEPLAKGWVLWLAALDLGFLLGHLGLSSACPNERDAILLAWAPNPCFISVDGSFSKA